MANPWNVFSRPVGAVAISASLLLGAGSALAQEDASTAGQIDLTNAPVDMHEGTCANPTLDPWAELGRLQRQDADDADDDDGLLEGIGIGDDGEDEEGFLTEDEDGDGVLDEGEDANDNGVLDAGIDEDGDGVLDENEVVTGEEAMAPGGRRAIAYTLEGEIDSGFEPLFDQQNIIAVHQSSEQYENIVACGNLGGIEYEDEQEIVVGMSSVDGSGVRGYAVFEFDPAIFGEGFTAVTVYMFEGLETQRESRVAATPDA